MTLLEEPMPVSWTDLDGGRFSVKMEDALLRVMCRFNRPTIRRGTPDEDQRQVTDYVSTSTVRFSTRVRRHGYLAAYGGQITVRTASRYGGRTEIDKILDGNAAADYMLYAFANEGEDDLAAWVIVDLPGLAAWMTDNRATLAEENNHDRSRFVGIDLDRTPHLVRDRFPVHQLTLGGI